MDNIECAVCEETIFYSEMYKHWMMRVENTNWNSYLDSMDYTDTTINFCPECGKDYRNIDGKPNNWTNL